jgi:hypothetical protein
MLLVLKPGCGLHARKSTRRKAFTWKYKDSPVRYTCCREAFPAHKRRD